MAKKTELSSERVSPGPGSYKDPISMSNWRKGAKIGSQERFKGLKRVKMPETAFDGFKLATARESTKMTPDDLLEPFGYQVEESYRKTARNTSPSFGF